jgi:hypothetical protein
VGLYAAHYNGDRANIRRIRKQLQAKRANQEYEFVKYINNRKQ